MDYEIVGREGAAILGERGVSSARLRALCDYLRAECPRLEWVGFYVAARERPLLALGPYAGKEGARERIAFGNGLAGTAAEARATVIEGALEGEEAARAPGRGLRSLIAAPCLREGGRGLSGVLVAYSREPSAFKRQDRELLEGLARASVPELEPLRKP